MASTICYEHIGKQEEVKRHGSCDEFNCASVKLFARMVLKLKTPEPCHRYITSEPVISCEMSDNCTLLRVFQLGHTHSKSSSVLPEQVGIARVHPNAYKIKECEHLRSQNLLGYGIDRSCNAAGCKMARRRAMIDLLSQVAEKSCHNYIRNPPNVCIQYDCIYV